MHLPRWTAVLSLALLLPSCEPGGPAVPGPDDDPSKATSQPLVCAPADLSAEAMLKAGPDGTGNRFVLANGRAITPAGTRFATGEFPLGLAVNADGTRAYVLHADDASKSIMVLDLTAAAPAIEPSAAPGAALLQTVALGSAFRGVALSPDGKTLAAGAGKKAKVHFFAVQEDGRLADPGESVQVAGYISEVAFTPDGARVLASASTSSKVFVIDVASRQVVNTLATRGAYPYDLLVSADGKTLWSTNLAAANVTALDLDSGALLATIPVGKGPEAAALSPDGKRLYVACADADRVDVIDTATRAIETSFDLTGNPQFLKHGNSGGLALSPDGATLYVAGAAQNRIDVVDTATGTLLGAIPTGWYPTEVHATASNVYVLSSKGMGNPDPKNLKKIPGHLAVFPVPDAARLATWTAQVAANNRRAEAFFANDCKPDNIPVLTGPGKSPIEHVILVVRENKTYDMVLGDLKDADGNAIGDGDPNLVVFGEKYTTNFHKLSREFTTLDNYYSNPEVSVQGHQWVTQAHCNDLMEKTWMDQEPIPGLDPALDADGPTGTIFDLCFANGVSFRNYGEFPSFGTKLFDLYKDFYDHKYPFWTMGVWDVDKAAEIIREWELGIFPQFIFIGLPNDHTYGGKAGFPTPQTMVADNDRATGLLMQWLSNSIYWPKTAVFIIEDDPQGTGDHVDPHRSVCTIVSPWVRRGYISSVHYDIPSVYRTIEQILGLPPMGKNDAYAPAMLDIWADGVAVPPDYTPFESVPVDVPYEVNPGDTLVAKLAEACDMKDVDGCEGMSRMLWLIMRGDEEPPAYARGIDR